MNIRLNSNTLGGGFFEAKRKKFGIRSLVFFLLFGAVFVGTGFPLVIGSQIDPAWTRVSGEVVDATSGVGDDTTMYAPVVQYSVQGHEYRVTASSRSSSYPNIGETREVAYNPDRPDQARVVESVGGNLLVWLFPLAGVALLISAPYLFVRSLIRARSIERLVRTGQKLQGVLIDIKSFPVGKHENNHQLVVSATDSAGVVQNYLSDPLNGIGGLAMMDIYKNPIPIDVYVDLANPQHYYVDISDIPNLTPERISAFIQSAARESQQQTMLNAKQMTPSTDTAQTVE